MEGKRGSLKTQLVLILVMMSFVPLSAVIILNLWTAYNSQMEAAETQSTQRTLLVQREIIAVIDHSINGLEALAASPLSVEFLKDTDTYMEQMTAAIMETNEIFGDENTTIITDAKGDQQIRSDGNELVNTESRDYYAKAMEGEDYVSKAVVSKATGKLIVILEVPVKDGDGKVLGFVQRDYSLDVLKGAVEAESDDDTDVFIVDELGRLLAHSSKEVVSEADMVDMSQERYYREAINGEMGSYKDKENGNDMYSYRMDSKTRWIVVTVISHSAIVAPAMRTMLLVVAISLVLLVIIGAVAFYIARMISMPVSKVSETVRQLADGNL